MIADKIAIRQRKNYGMVMNQIRTKIISQLMKHNANMILSSMQM